MAIADKVCAMGDELLGNNALSHPKLQQHKMINILTKELSPRVAKFYLFASLQGDVLVFYFSHNAIVMEFNNELAEFRKKIIPLYKEHNMKETLFFKHIEARVKYRAIKREPTPPKEIEKAKGEFEIKCKDKSLYKIFEKIRENIKEYRDD